MSNALAPAGPGPGRRCIGGVMLGLILFAIGGCALFKDQSVDVASACLDPAHRQFDFWLGDWEVRQPGSSPPYAANSIARIVQGCALQEIYRSPQGYTGKSLNWYEAETGLWRQTWVDNSGLVLQLAGGLNAQGHMVLEGGERITAQAETVRDRITWMAQADDTVLQVWEVLRSDASEWERIFTGLYRRREPAARAAPRSR